MAFIPSKFRLDIEPEPFALELDLRTTPWSLRDITAQLTTEGQVAAKAYAQQERQKLEDAAFALGRHLRNRQHPGVEPLLKTDACKYLQGLGLAKRQAINLLEDGFNADVHPEEGLWRLQPLPDHPSGKAVAVVLVEKSHAAPSGEEDGGKRSGGPRNPSNDAVSSLPPFPTGSTASGKRSAPRNPSNDAIFTATTFFRQSSGPWEKVDGTIASNGADFPGWGLFPRHNFIRQRMMTASPSEEKSHGQKT
jgi:hypothetical protein